MAKRKRKNSAEKRVEIQKEEEIKREVAVANVPLQLKSRFVPFIKMHKKPRGFKIVQIEGNDYYEFEGLDGVYFNKVLFV